MLKKIQLLLTLTVLLLSACAGSADLTLLPGANKDSNNPAASTASTPGTNSSAVEALEPTSKQTEVNVALEIEIPAGAEVLLDLTITDLAQQLGVNLTEITLVSFEEVLWSNTSLSCPQPGIANGEVLTPGFLVRLDAQGQIYEYHTDKAQHVILCASISPNGQRIKAIDKNVEDGWPSQTKDKGVIVVTPTRQ